MENILDGYKPDSIFEHIPREWFLKQTLEENYIDSGTCYEYYYAIGDYYKPKSILEIGILFGYSAAALILGATRASKDNLELFESYDMDYYERRNFKHDSIGDTQYYSGEVEFEDWSSNKIAYHKLDELIDEKIGPDHNLEFNIMTKNSQRLRYLPKYYDMIHIDGGHLAHEKLHDLKLTLGRCGVVIVDDYDFIDAVKEVTDKFVDDHSNYILNTNHVKSFRGTLIIEYKNGY